MAKILLVEDDNNLREIYEARLQAEGYEIVSANDGEAALVVAKSEKPDLVISDVMMPKISGFEMLDILRNTQGLEDVKVIMLTALGQADDQARANKLGADRYLVKSQVTLEDIVKVSHELLEGSAPAATSSTDATEPSQATTATAAEEPVAATPVPEPVPAVQTIPVSAPPAEDAIPAPAPAEPAVTTDNTPVSLPDVPVAPAPEPVAPSVNPAPPVVQPSTPEPPTASAPVTAQPTPTVVPSEAPTASSEESAVEEQIQDFISNQPAEPPAAVDPQPTPDAPTEPDVTTPETPTEPSVTPAANTTEAADQAVLDSAVDTIVANGNAEAAGTTVPTPPVITVEPPAQRLTPPEQQAEETTNDSAPVAHKKVIKPLDSQPGKSLDELLANEEANTPPPPPQPVLGDVSTPTPAAPAIDEDQPAGAAAPPPHVAGTVIDPDGNHIDPNNIAL
ncbi:MAG TPA: response regulator [Candidatus Saccharimonadales bacterium]|nr:response regulator [Candidatus Saccharimonadales bacterium]